MYCKSGFIRDNFVSQSTYDKMLCEGLFSEPEWVEKFFKGH